MSGRGLILAAPASGSGKTLITAGLARHLRIRGLKVAAAKAGPDFIDPTFHLAATGRTCLNLDVWAMRSSTVKALVAELEASAEIVLCEGVMGLFDGTGPDGDAGSTAELARLTGWPVVLVIDARGQGASVAALLRGFVSHQQDLPFAGVIFNRVSSRRHADVLERAVTRHLPSLAYFGALPFDPLLVLPSRHLGLVPAGETGDAEPAIGRCAEQIGGAFDIDRLLGSARNSSIREGAATSPMPPLGQRTAVARDHAFCFAYGAVLDGWRRQGAEISFFSPLADEGPDPDADAVYLPGGYPELSARHLSGAERFLAGLRQAAVNGKAVYGECGGYMVLGEGIVDAEGRRCRMAGLLPLVTSFAERRLQLGYRSITLQGNGPLGAAGSRFRGHEFHHAVALDEGAGDRLLYATDASGTDLGPQGLQHGSVSGSFIHLIDRRDPQDE